MVNTIRRKIKFLSIMSMLSLVLVVLAPVMGAGQRDLKAEEPELAPLLEVTLSPGDTAGATSATVTGHVYGSLVVNVTDEEIATPYVGDPAPTAGDYLITGYESGTDITAGVTTGNYLQVYAVDMEDQALILGFYQAQLTEGDIKTADMEEEPVEDQMMFNMENAGTPVKNMTSDAENQHTGSYVVEANEVWKSTMSGYGPDSVLEFGGGNGSFDEPYLISTAVDLVQLAVNVNNGQNYQGKHFQMTDDIVLGYWQDDGDGIVEDGEIYDSPSGGTAYTVSNWTPIGINSGVPFKGTFDGAGHTISGIYINAPSSSFQGLFGYVILGSIKNLGVKDSYIKGYQYVGGITGGCSRTMIENSFNTGSVNGFSQVGGLVGQYLDTGIVEYCYNTGSVSSTYFAGGIVGQNDYSGTIQYCYNTGRVSGSYYTGGILGENIRGTIQYCFNIGSINSGGSFVGGVAGRNNDEIKNCYNTGDVSSNQDIVGGVVGKNDGTVQYCYNTGSVSGTISVGGVVGQNTTIAEVADSYYDRQMCPEERGIGNGGGNVEGKLTRDMTDGVVFDGWSSGDTGTWDFTSGLYPRLTGYVNASTDYRMDETNAAFVSVAPVFLVETETKDTVHSNFTLSTANGVTWTSSDSGVIDISGGSGTVEGVGTAVLTASLNGVSKNLTLTVVDVTPPKLKSATRVSNTQIIVELSEPCLNLNKNNNGGFKVTKTGTEETFAVSRITRGSDASHVVLTVADIATAAVKGLTVTYTAGGYGTITDIEGNKMETDSTGVNIEPWTTKLETPGTLAWDTTTPAKAAWGTVEYASSYTVQLYKDGSAHSTRAGITNTYYDFTAAITETGAYTFTVQAIGDGATYRDSDISSSSPIYNYKAPSASTGSSGGSSRDSGESSTPSTPSAPTANTDVDILVNGKTETAATATTARKAIEQ